MAQKSRRIFTNEPKAEAVRIVEQSGKSANQVALARPPFADLANNRAMARLLSGSSMKIMSLTRKRSPSTKKPH
jgi:hypothetical protein